MTCRLKDLQARQQELKAQSNLMRREFEEHFEALEKPLFWAGKGLDVFHFFKNKPLLFTSMFAALAYFKPKPISKALALVGAVKLFKSILRSS